VPRMPPVPRCASLRQENDIEACENSNTQHGSRTPSRKPRARSGGPLPKRLGKPYASIGKGDINEQRRAKVFSLCSHVLQEIIFLECCGEVVFATQEHCEKISHEYIVIANAGP
jgi:hypothetical protein